MSRLILYTCIVGGCDPIKALPPMADWQKVAFTDNTRLLAWGHPDWEMRKLATSCGDTCRTARWHKHHPLQLFPDCKLSVWLDATHWPKHNLRWVEEFMGSAEFACWKHPLRTTVTAEAWQVLHDKLDDPQTVTEQLRRYTAAGFPDQSGLFGTACLIRRHTADVDRFQQNWWAEIESGSRRDQLSLPYVVYQHPELSRTIIPGEPRGHNPYFDCDLSEHDSNIWNSPGN